MVVCVRACTRTRVCVAGWLCVCACMSAWVCLQHGIPKAIAAVLNSSASVFSEFRDIGQKYKARIRSRVANLGDVKNPDLCASVVSGSLPPARVAVMTAEVGAVRNKQ